MTSASTSRVCGLLLVVLCAASLIGCGGTSPDEVRAAGAYETVVRWLLAEEFGDEPDPEVSLFFESLTADEIPLEVQVEMIALLDDFENVRFIDDAEEAVDVDLVAYPVHDDGLLIGLGALSPDEPTVVRAELYRDRGRVSGYRFTLNGSGASWRVDGDPEIIPAEELTGVGSTDD